MHGHAYTHAVKMCMQACMFAITCLREQRVSARMVVQAGTAVPPNVSNTIIVSSQKEPLPEFYFRKDSSGALSACAHI